MVDAANLPWWAIATGVVVAIATSVLASRRPAKTMARVPVVAALSGRPAPPKPVHRSALPGVIVFAAGVACLAFTGGLAGRRAAGTPATTRAAPAGRPGRHDRRDPPARPAGRQRAGSRRGPRLPVAVRIALRDLVRYRARSGAALAATTFAVFLAMAICLAASIQVRNPLNWIGPNLSGSQLIVYPQQSQGGGMMTQLSNAQTASLGGQVNSLAASLHTRSVCRWNPPGDLYQGARRNSPANFTGAVYVATPQLLATYGIKASQIAPGTDILTMRPGLAGLPQMEMIWSNSGYHVRAKAFPGSAAAPPCTLSNDCLANPVIQTVSSLPGGTSAPNTVITEYAVSKYHLQPSLNGWLIQAPAPLTATQINAARQLALAYKVTVETKSGTPGLGEFADGATVLGIVIALGVLAASVGLIRSETARDLRTLTATGASAATRRMITAATAAALGLLGAILGMAGAVIAGLAWAHSSLSAM